MKRLLKLGALRTLRASGALSAAMNSPWRRNRLLILCYHGIALRDEHEWNGALYISPEMFRRRLALLKKWNVNVLPLAEALTALFSRQLPARSAVITFDDGFHDFLRHGIPALRESGYPCTLYLTTHYSRYPLPIFNLIVPYMLWKSGRSTVDLAGLGLTGPMPVRTYHERRFVTASLVEKARMRNLSTTGKDEWARHIAASLSLDYDDLLQSRMLQIMTPEETAAAHQSGVADLQLHTHRHRTPRDRELFLKELFDNAACIRGATGLEPSHFCYPSGDHAPEMLPWLKEAGINSATTCIPGLAAFQSDPLLLPRQLDHSGVSEAEFESWLAGLVVS